MKKLISILLSLTMILTACGFVNITAVAQNTVNEVSTFDEIQNIINSAPIDTMNGEPTYIKLTSDITSVNGKISIMEKKNIYLDLNGHILNIAGISIGQAGKQSGKLTIVNGKYYRGPDQISQGSLVSSFYNSIFTAKNVVFENASNSYSYVLFFHMTAVDISNCEIKETNKNSLSVVFFDYKTSGKISNTIVTREEGTYSNPIIKFYQNSTIVDGLGNELPDLYDNSINKVSFSLMDSIQSFDETASHDVYGNFIKGKLSPTIYSVDVTWGSMNFTYEMSDIGKWNPHIHDYEGTVGEWKWADNANKITVRNHSNTGINATLSYEKVAGYDFIGGFFNETTKGTQIPNNKIFMETAVGTDPKNPPIGNAYFQIVNGRILTNPISNIGTVTVTLS